MTYMNKTFGAHVMAEDGGSSAGRATREAVVLVIEDDFGLSKQRRIHVGENAVEIECDSKRH